MSELLQSWKFDVMPANRTRFGQHVCVLIIVVKSESFVNALLLLYSMWNGQDSRKLKLL